ncbi:MAG: DUF2306 domain-containing protein [Gammaproteobacteria bacterium]
MSGSRAAWTLAALTCVMFALLAMEFPLALRADRGGSWATAQAWLTGEAYSFGAGSAHQMYPVYRRALGAMTSHTFLGGMALALGMLQFAPSLRRRYRTLHRAAGVFVILAVVLSMAGALTYLARTPLASTYASPGFGLALWALSLVALAYTALAILALQRRDYRTHMGFMALMMSTLLTAPVLRFEWALFGALLPLDMSAVNQGVVTSLAVITTLMMAVWMQRVGSLDLPPRARFAVFPPALIRALAGAAMAVVVHESLCAPHGYDLFAAWRSPAARLPALAVTWALPTVWLLWRVPGAIGAAIAGAPIAPACRHLALAAAAGALVTAWATPRVGVDSIGLVFYWAALGAILAALVAAGRRADPAREPWTLFWLFLTLAPALWPVLHVIAWLSGQDARVGTWFACTIGAAAMTANAFITAYALVLPTLFRRARESRGANGAGKAVA